MALTLLMNVDPEQGRGNKHISAPCCVLGQLEGWGLESPESLLSLVWSLGWSLGWEDVYSWRPDCLGLLRHLCLYMVSPHGLFSMAASGKPGAYLHVKRGRENQNQA